MTTDTPIETQPPSVPVEPVVETPAPPPLKRRGRPPKFNAPVPPQSRRRPGRVEAAREALRKKVTKRTEIEEWRAALKDEYTFILLAGPHGVRHTRNPTFNTVVRVPVEDRKASCYENQVTHCPFLNGRLEPVAVNPDLWSEFDTTNVATDEFLLTVLDGATDAEFTEYLSMIVSVDLMRRLVPVAATLESKLSIAKATAISAKWSDLSRPSVVHIDEDGKARLNVSTTDADTGTGSVLSAGPRGVGLPHVG